MTRSKEIVNLAFQLDIGIQYHNVLYLHECWALDESERQPLCPAEIVEDKAGTVIIDNNDFKDVDLTGGTTYVCAILCLCDPKVDHERF